MSESDIHKVLDELIVGQLEIQCQLAAIKENYTKMSIKLDEIEFLCHK